MARGPYSPAALALMAEGVTLGRVAEALDTTPTSVSRWLSGHFPAPPELFGVIAALASRELADEVRRLIPDGEAVAK